MKDSEALLAALSGTLIARGEMLVGERKEVQRFADADRSRRNAECRKES